MVIVVIGVMGAEVRAIGIGIGVGWSKQKSGKTVIVTVDGETSDGSCVAMERPVSKAMAAVAVLMERKYILLTFDFVVGVFGSGSDRG